jgi:hypothetical protein
MPSLGIAPAPEDYGARPPITPQGRYRLQAPFRQAFTCAFWRLGFRQSGFRHITRISRRTAPDAWARPPVSWHAIFPCILSDSGKPSDPEISPPISARCAGDTTVRLMAHAVCNTIGSVTAELANPDFSWGLMAAAGGRLGVVLAWILGRGMTAVRLPGRAAGVPLGPGVSLPACWYGFCLVKAGAGSRGCAARR